MKSVSRFEADLLRMLRALLGHAPAEQAVRVMTSRRDRPRCLSRNAVELVQDTLAKGIVLWFAERGWRVETHLRNDAAVAGRLWERTPNEYRRLEFSAASLEWLIWLTSEHPGTSTWEPTAFELTLADEILLAITIDRLADLPAASSLVEQPVFQTQPLPQLLRAGKFGKTHAGSANFLPWLEPDRAWVLEALQRDLADRWAELEFSKWTMSDWRELQKIGKRQLAVIDRFLGAVEQTHRWDLARFLLEAVRKLLPGVLPRSPWFPNLNVNGLRIADRTAVYDSGLLLFHQLQRLQAWEQNARGVSYIDEHYAASQLWKSDWERLRGPAVSTLASEILSRHVAFRV